MAKKYAFIYFYFRDLNIIRKQEKKYSLRAKIIGCFPKIEQFKYS